MEQPVRFGDGEMHLFFWLLFFSQRKELSVKRKQVVWGLRRKRKVSRAHLGEWIEEGNGWARVRTHLRFVVINLKWDNPRGCVRSSSARCASGQLGVLPGSERLEGAGELKDYARGRVIAAGLVLAGEGWQWEGGDRVVSGRSHWGKDSGQEPWVWALDAGG